MGCPVLGLDNLQGMISMKEGHRAGENIVTPAVTLPARWPACVRFTSLKLLQFALRLAGKQKKFK